MKDITSNARLLVLTMLAVPVPTSSADFIYPAKLESESPDRECKATFHVRIYSRPSQAFDHFPSVWGSHGEPYAERESIAVVYKARIHLYKKEVSVPPSAYLDLASLTSMGCKKSARENGYRVEFHGGDASTAYDGFFLLKNGRLVERQIKHGEDPDYREKTSYFYPEYDDSL